LTPEEQLDQLRELQAGFKSLDGLVRGNGTDLHPGIIGVLTSTAKTSQANAAQLTRMKYVVLGAAVGGSLTGGGAVAALTQVWAG
jgi:hypothetical protein